MDNEKADHHKLTPEQELFFTNLTSIVSTIIQEILDQNKLKGQWVVSEDLKWLVKIGE